MTALAAPREVAATPRLAPWGTVLPLAVLLGYVDGFWVAALQTAVGSVQRTSAPAVAAWWWSTLLLPGFAFAVLAAVRRGARWAAAGRSATVATGGLVAVAATAVGVAVMAASAVYDYGLQAEAMAAMQGMHSACDADCLDRQRVATVLAHLKGIGVGTGLVLISNLALVTWWVTLRGGRLDLGAPEPQPVGNGRARDLRTLLAVALGASAVIHLAEAPAHLAAWPAGGWSLVVLAVAQAGAAAALVLGIRGAVWATVVVSAGALLIWVWSRAGGLPDALVGLLELGALLGAAALLRGWRGLTGPRPTSAARWLAVLAVVAVSAVGVGATAPVGTDDGGGVGGHPEMAPPR